MCDNQGSLPSIPVQLQEERAVSAITGGKSCEKTLKVFLYFIPIILHTAFEVYAMHVGLWPAEAIYRRLVTMLLLIGMVGSTVAGVTGRSAVAAGAGFAILASFLPFFAGRLPFHPGSAWIPLIGGIVLIALYGLGLLKKRALM